MPPLKETLALLPESVQTPECPELGEGGAPKALPPHIEEADWSIVDEKRSLLKSMADSLHNLFSSSDDLARV